MAERPAVFGDQAAITARAIKWDQDSSAQWTDQHYGFCIIEEQGDELPFSASWGEDDAEQFATLEEAMTWCQAQIDSWISKRAVIFAPAPSPTSAPIDMVLHCPVCGLQHVDAPEKVSEARPVLYSDAWTNPPHRSHLCHGCGHIWRPADVPTNGVAAVKTKGKADSPMAMPAAGWRDIESAPAVAVAWRYPDGKPYTLTWAGTDEARVLEVTAQRGLLRTELVTRAQLDEAVAAERERCADLCETARFTGNTFPITQLEQLRMDIAAAIRTAQERT